MVSIFFSGWMGPVNVSTPGGSGYAFVKDQVNLYWLARIYSFPVWTRCRYTAKQRPNVFIFSESDARYNDLCVCYRIVTVCTTSPKIDDASGRHVQYGHLANHILSKRIQFDKFTFPVNQHKRHYFQNN